MKLSKDHINDVLEVNISQLLMKPAAVSGTIADAYCITDEGEDKTLLAESWKYGCWKQG